MFSWWRQQTLEVKIANQCAPVLAGVKPANVLVLENNHIRDVVHTLDGTEIAWRCLYAGKEKNIWLLYRKDDLGNCIFQEEALDFLRKYGYTEASLERMLDRFGRRFREYRNSKDVAFPHEMGVFLGYPMEDVKGFVENEGKNYLYCGYWKVYGNVEKCKELFRIYNEVKNVFVQEASKGKKLLQITREWQYMTA